MDLYKYEMLVETINHGSLSKAAATMNYSRSTVAKSISALEYDLRIKLVQRNNHGIVPTDECMRLLPEITEMLSKERNLLQYASELRDKSNFQIRIGTQPIYSIKWMPQIIQTFRKKHPSFHISLSVDSEEVIKQKLENGEIDFAIGSKNILPSNCNWQSLLKLEIFAYIPRKFLTGREDTFDLNEILNYPAIVVPGEPVCDMIINTVDKNNIGNLLYYSVVDGYMIRDLCIDGICSVFLTELYNDRPADEYVVKSLNPKFYKEIGIASKQLSKVSKSYLSMIISEFSSLIKTGNKS